MKDKYSEQRLALLHPKVRDTFRNFIDECESTFGITLRIMMGYRSIDEQNELYSQGRTKPGKIVTNAKGGQSFHNFGLAVDLCQMDEATDSEINWNYDMGTLQPIATKYGLEWGGSWVHIKDKPHFEARLGYPEDCAALLIKVQNGEVDENGYINTL